MSKIGREVQALLGLPSEVVKRVRTKMAAYRKAVREVESGYSDAGLRKMAKARDAIDYAISDAVAHVPYVPGEKPHLSPAIVELERERNELVRGTWEAALERGRSANASAHRAEIKRLDEEIREANRPFDWIKR